VIPLPAKPVSLCISAFLSVRVCGLRDKILPPVHRGRVAGKKHQMIPCLSSSQGCRKRTISLMGSGVNISGSHKGDYCLGVRDSADAEKGHYLLCHLAPSALVGGVL